MSSAALRAVGVDRVFSGGSLRCGRCFRGSCRLRLAGRRARERRRPLSPLAPAASSITPEHLADLHVLAILAIDAREDAGLCRRDLEVDLVGLELDQRIADGDGVAFLLQPLRDAGVDDRLADFGTTMLTA